MNEKRVIKNPEHYFNKFISCEIKNDRKKQIRIRAKECSLDEKLEDGQVPLTLVCNCNDELFEELFTSQEKLLWLENIENEGLYYALCRLKNSQINLIYLHLVKGYSQREIAVKLKVNQKTVSTNIGRALNKLKKFYKTYLKTDTFFPS